MKVRVAEAGGWERNPQGSGDRRSRRARSSPLPALFGLAGSVLLASCAFLSSPARTFHSNEPLLEELARQAGYVVDPALYRLVQAEVLEDSLTLHYRGVAHPGDAAWVLRFYLKSSEQDPDSIADVATVLPVLSEGREGFQLTEHGKRDAAGVEIQFARYRFQGPVRDAEGKPLPACGILVTFLARQGAERLAYHIKLDNQGDRDDVDWADLAPFLVPVLGQEAVGAPGETR